MQERRPDLSPEIEAIVQQAFAKDPDQRPSSVLELSQAFAQAAAAFEPTEPIPPRSAKIVVPVRNTFFGPIGSTNRETYATALQSARFQQSTAHSQLVSTPLQAWWASYRLSALVSLALVVLLGAGIIYTNYRAEHARTLQSIAGAQQAITLASSQISLLPQEHALYAQIPALTQWQSELTGYASVSKLPPALQARVKTLEQLATQYAEQARQASNQLQILAAQQDTLTDDSPNALEPGQKKR